MTPQFRFAQPSFRDGIVPVGATPPIFGPRPLFVDFGADFDVPAGCGIADRRAGQAAHGNLDLARAAPMKRLEANVAVLDDGSVELVGYWCEAQLVPEAVYAPKLTVGGERDSIERPRRGIAPGTLARR